MRRQAQLSALKMISKVGDLLQLAAELDVARAIATLHQRDEEQQRELEQLDHDRRRHELYLQAKSFSPDIAMGWSNVIQKDAERLQHCETAVAQAEANFTLKTASWKKANARTDAIRILIKKSTRRINRLYEEATLAELTDNVSRRRIRP